MEKITALQTGKDLARDYLAALDTATPERIAQALSTHTAPEYRFRGFHPFNEISTPSKVAERVWIPLRRALTSMQRRVDIFFAGQNEITPDDGVWVVHMGHLMGLFDAPFLGIPPTGKMAFLRYCEFLRVKDGLIHDVVFYFDLPHLMMQAGVNPFPPQTAAHLVQPGPQTHDGLLYSDQPPQEGQATLALINRMITDLGQWKNDISLEDELRRTWAEDMIWWGPAGIGATYTIPRYAQQHSGPFRAGFADRTKTNHIARLAEGHYGGFFGFPNFTATPTGGFMGMPATGKPGEFRVIDIYRRAGDKLAENWIFIDLLHFWKTQGLDVLARMEAP